MFAQSIQFSGSIFASWTNSNLVLKTSQKLAKFLKCPLTTTKKIKDCLQSKTSNEIAQTAAKIVCFYLIYKISKKIIYTILLVVQIV